MRAWERFDSPKKYYDDPKIDRLITMSLSAHPHCEHHDHPTATLGDHSPQRLEVAAAMCQAMGDPARLRLLLWLSQREMCVSELVEHEQAKLSSISARLQVLHAARLVTRRKEAKHVIYALADQHVRDLLSNILGHAAETSA
jgi:DNA-binding transcriptional ArsR family regulator